MGGGPPASERSEPRRDAIDRADPIARALRDHGLDHRADQRRRCRKRTFATGRIEVAVELAPVLAGDREPM